jgi:hypothetical protein
LAGSLANTRASGTIIICGKEGHVSGKSAEEETTMLVPCPDAHETITKRACVGTKDCTDSACYTASRQLSYRVEGSLQLNLARRPVMRCVKQPLAFGQDTRIIPHSP